MKVLTLMPMEGTMELSISEAAKHLDVSPDTIRRRIRKGELEARQMPRGKGFAWSVTIDAGTFFPGQDSGDLVTALRDRIEAQEQELDSRRQEVSELHRLLAARSLPEARERPWWRFWG